MLRICISRKRHIILIHLRHSLLKLYNLSFKKFSVVKKKKNPLKNFPVFSLPISTSFIKKNKTQKSSLYFLPTQNKNWKMLKKLNYILR